MLGAFLHCTYDVCASCAFRAFRASCIWISLVLVDDGHILVTVPLALKHCSTLHSAVSVALCACVCVVHSSTTSTSTSTSIATEHRAQQQPTNGALVCLHTQNTQQLFIWIIDGSLVLRTFHNIFVIWMPIIEKQSHSNEWNGGRKSECVRTGERTKKSRIRQTGFIVFIHLL